MAPFTNRSLGLLERVYKFVGGLKSTSEVDLAAPIQLVHDVGPGAREHQYVTAPNTGSLDTGVGNATDFLARSKSDLFTGTVQSRLLERGLYPTDVDVWLLGAWLALENATASNLQTAAIGVTYTPSSGFDVPMLIQWGDANGSAWESGGYRPLQDSLPSGVWPKPLPMNLGPISDDDWTLWARLSAGAGGQVVGRCLWLLQYRPRP